MPDTKKNSLLFLSLLCFALADVRDGLGPFLGVFLQGQNWTADEIGFVMSAGGFAGLLLTTPLGAFVDYSNHKRWILGFSVLFIILSCGIIFLWNNAAITTLSKVLSAIAAAAIMPALTGLTLGMVGQHGLPARLGINEAWSHAGNALTALSGGIIGYFWGIPGVFYVMAFMGALALCSLWKINAKDIDYAAARGLSSEKGDNGKPEKFSKLFSDKALLAIGLTLFFFHLGNAALLPLLGQSAVAQFDMNPAAYTASTIILAQATMIATALWAAHIVPKYGYGTVFLIALTALPIRGCIAGIWDNPWNIIPVQLLDGVGAGLLGVATPGIAARLLQGGGHINTGLGLVMTIQGVGASISNTYGGLFAHYLGYNAAFIALAAAPCLGIMVFVLALKKFPHLRHALKHDTPYNAAVQS